MSESVLVRLRVAAFGMALACALFAACSGASASPAVAEHSDEQLLRALLDGSASLTKLTMSSGYKVAREEGKAVDSFRYAYDGKQWEQLAIQVMRVNSGSDLSWYYLGRAAEELGQLQAAAIYYEKSIVASSKRLVSACVGKVCSGFAFPEEAEARLEAVRQKQQ